MLPTSSTLMLIDPCKVFQATVMRAFQARGIKVVCCDSGTQAMTSLLDRQRDLICVALDLPDGGGIEWSRRIRALPAYCGVPIALCADQISAKQQTQALCLGVSEVFLKREVKQLVNVFSRMAAQARPIMARILYVEHSVVQARPVLEQLARNGLQADWFKTAQAALSAIEEMDYDLVLTNLKLGRGVSGATLAKCIRRMDSKQYAIPILALTAWDDTAQRSELFKIGIDDYVIKPVVEEELLARIRLLIERKNLAAELSANKDSLEQTITARTHELQLARGQLQATLDAIFEVDKNGQSLAYHASSVELLDRSSDDLIGKSIGESLSAESAEILMQALQEARDHRVANGKQSRLDLPDGELKPGQPPPFVDLAHGISDCKTAEERANYLARLYSGLSGCRKAIVHCKNEGELFGEICRIAVETGGLAMAWVGIINQESRMVHPVASFGDANGYLDDLQVSAEADSPFGGSPIGIAIRDQHPCWCQSFEGSMMAPWRERIAFAGWESSAALPLLENGEAIGVVALYARRPDFFDAEAQSLLTDIALDVSYALDKFAFDEQRERSEFALRDSEFAARLALDNARATLEQLKHQKYALDQHAIVATTDTRGKITYANDKFCEISGYAREELLGQDHALLNSGKHPAGFFKTMYETIARGESWHGEVCNRSKAGHLYWLDTTVVPFLGETGKPEQYIAIRADITERKRTEQALSAREEIYRSIVTQASDGIVLVDLETLRFIEFNDAASKSLGYSREEFVELRVTDIHMELDVAGVLLHVEQIAKNGRGSFETLHRHKDGTPRNMHISYRVITLAERPYVVAILTDITERKASELELKRHREHLEELVEQQTKGLQSSVATAERALAELKQQKFVLDQHAIVTISNLSGTITYGNDKFSEVSGYSREEFIGKDHQLLNSGYHPKGFFRAMYETIAQGKVWHAEVCNRAKDGHLYWVDSTIVAFMGPDGMPCEYIAVRTDITESKRIEAAAQAANRAKSEFLANMSHEIRTPMNGVVGMVDILQQTSLTAEQGRMLSTINDSSLALLNILNDILDYSKIEAGKLAIECLPTQLLSVAEGAVQLMIATSSAKAIDLLVFVSPELPRWIRTDPTRLRQILLNLLGNAVKFTSSRDGRRGRVRLCVEACTWGDGRPGVQFRVVDNGIGVSKEAMADLFLPFTQADESTARKYGGTGLGLSITQRLVDMLGGSISVNSVLGEGSEFTVRLPLQEAISDYLPEAEPSLAGIHALAVTGDAECAETFIAYCIAAGAEVTLVGDLATAHRLLAEAAQRSTATVVLLGLDVSPESDGSLPASMGVVRLVDDGIGSVSGNRVTVSARPLLYRDLIQGVAFASGRLTARDVSDRTEHGAVLSDRKAPGVEEALRAGQLILLAEDNETNRDVMREQLRILGYAVEMAEDGVAALKMWRSGRYALLLTDCHMPNMDGFALTAAIRQAEPAGTRLPIIAVTANAMKGEAQRALKHGMDDYLSKPLRLNELSPMLDKWLPLPDALASKNRQEVADESACGAVAEFAPCQRQAAHESLADAAEHPDAPFAVWDATTLTLLVGDNPRMHHQLLKKFLLNAPAQIAAIGVAAAAGETGDLAEVAHKLKSSARTVGALALGELCQEGEDAGRSDDRLACSALAARFDSVFSAAAAKIEKAISAQESRS